MNQRVLRLAKVPAPKKAQLQKTPFIDVEKLAGLSKTFYNVFVLEGGYAEALLGETLSVKSAARREHYLQIYGKLLK